jgi:hypothetical protein
VGSLVVSLKRGVALTLINDPKAALSNLSAHFKMNTHNVGRDGRRGFVV